MRLQDLSKDVWASIRSLLHVSTVELKGTMMATLQVKGYRFWYLRHWPDCLGMIIRKRSCRLALFGYNWLFSAYGIWLGYHRCSMIAFLFTLWYMSLCYRCVPCYWTLTCLLTQWLRGWFNSPYFFFHCKPGSFPLGRNPGINTASYRLLFTWQAQSQWRLEHK